MEIAALLTIAPEGSLTVPRIVPPATCANDAVGTTANSPQTHNPKANFFPHAEKSMMVLLLISRNNVVRPHNHRGPANESFRAHFGLRIIGDMPRDIRSFRVAGRYSSTLLRVRVVGLTNETWV
jgi:hypothetical protein